MARRSAFGGAALAWAALAALTPAAARAADPPPPKANEGPPRLEAKASEEPRRVEKYAILFGANAGGTSHTSSNVLLGGEMSFVRFNDGLWFGVYTDLLYDQGLRRMRFSLGPELGIGPFGVDLGYVRELSQPLPMQGWRVRGIISVIVLSAYLGPGTLHDGSQKLNYWEGGLLFKAPLALWPR